MSGLLLRGADATHPYKLSGGNQSGAARQIQPSNEPIWPDSDKPSLENRRKTAIILRIMPASPSSSIPNRVETLRVLRLMGDYEPILMLVGSDDGYGTRWTLGGQQVQPAIARYLMETGCVAESGRTQFGARTLALTAAGVRFRERGITWWDGLNLFEKLKAIVLG